MNKKRTALDVTYEAVADIFEQHPDLKFYYSDLVLSYNSLGLKRQQLRINLMSDVQAGRLNADEAEWVRRWVWAEIQRKQITVRTLLWHLWRFLLHRDPK